MHESMHRTLLYLSAYPAFNCTSPKPKAQQEHFFMDEEEGYECTFKDEFRGPVFVTESHPST